MSLLPIPVGLQPCRHRRQREGRRVGKDGSTERTRLRATALRVQQHVPGPPEARYHRAEVGRGMLMDGVALEQALLPVQDGERPHRAVPQEDRQVRQRHLLVVRPRS